MLLAQAVFSDKEYKVFFTKLPSALECSLGGTLPPFDPFFIVAAFSTMIAKQSLKIEASHVARLQGQGCLYFTDELHNAALTSLRMGFHPQHSMLQTWLEARFQLERLQFLTQHYPQT